MTQTGKKASAIPIIFGILLIVASVLIRTPGGALTTSSSLDGDKAGSYYNYDRYSAIDEYVGGDAYNFIIGASLVGGRISGVITAKAILFSAGCLCLCCGLTIRRIETSRLKETMRIGTPGLQQEPDAAEWSPNSYTPTAGSEPQVPRNEGNHPAPAGQVESDASSVQGEPVTAKTT